MKIIVINNPAAKEGGALTILEQFLEKIYNSRRKSKFYCFVSVESLKRYEKENLKIIVLPKQSFKERILWDNFGLKKYLKNNNIKPNLFISLQNTGVNLDKSIPQVLYYHQPLPLSCKEWSFLKKEERIYWFYKNIYPFFIRQYLGRVKKIVVQTSWVKEAFYNRFKYPLKNIFVVKPTINLPELKEINETKREKFRIFFPAIPQVYKNHKLIVDVLGKLKKSDEDLENKIECIFTFSEKDNSKLFNEIKNKKLENIVKLIGKIPYEKVLEYYKNSDLMIFPSYIETLGLPLLEAQHFDLEILVIDLPYSREVVGDYKKVVYFSKENVEEELKKILKKGIKDGKNINIDGNLQR